MKAICNADKGCFGLDYCTHNCGHKHHAGAFWGGWPVGGPLWIEGLVRSMIPNWNQPSSGDTVDRGGGGKPKYCVTRAQTWGSQTAFRCYKKGDGGASVGCEAASEPSASYLLSPPTLAPTTLAPTTPLPSLLPTHSPSLAACSQPQVHISGVASSAQTTITAAFSKCLQTVVTLQHEGSVPAGPVDMDMKINGQSSVTLGTRHCTSAPTANPSHVPTPAPSHTPSEVSQQFLTLGRCFVFDRRITFLTMPLHK